MSKKPSKSARDAARDNKDITLMIRYRDREAHVSLLRDTTAELEEHLHLLGDDLATLRSAITSMGDKAPPTLREVEHLKTFQRHQIKHELDQRHKGVGRSDVRYLLAFYEAAHRTLSTDDIARVEAAIAPADESSSAAQ